MPTEKVVPHCHDGPSCEFPVLHFNSPGERLEQTDRQTDDRSDT